MFQKWNGDVIMQRIDVLAIFAKVGTLGSISGAARALGLPKANVSRAVARLEAEYNVALIERTTKRVMLTEIGAKLHERCQRLLVEFDEVDAEIAAYRGDPSGTLRVSCPAAISTHIGPYLPDFLNRYPGIDLRLKVADRVLPEPHGFDVVLHVGWLADSSLIARKVADVPLILTASAEYVATHGMPLTPDELEQHPVVGLYYADGDVEGGGLPATVPPLELARGGECVPLPRWKRFSSNDQMLLLDLVERGMAIAPLAAALIQRKVMTGELVRILPEYDIVNPPALHAVYASRSAQPPKVRVFIEFLTATTQLILTH